MIVLSEDKRSPIDTQASAYDLSASMDASPLYHAEDNSTVGHCSVTGDGLSSMASVTKDGRINIELDLRTPLPDLPIVTEESSHELPSIRYDASQFPMMNVVIMIVGSRGDVQPYIALGKRLLEDRHRVRIATHGTFRQFVSDHGLEFFDIGGNPQDLMSYMVKNPGLMPGIESLTNGDIKRKRTMLTEMIHGCWESCYQPCPQTGKAFIADAIISNPPAFAHVHCAEALRIPLLMSFTMPWSPTSSFPHPLVNINQSNAEKRLTNFLTYHMAEMLTWQGLGDIINTFRAESLGLAPLSLHSGPGILETLQIPWTYCMSPALVPKPSDWLSHIDVVGFYFLDLATNYTPPPALQEFLNTGDAPIYIGFGSVVVDDPAAMTNIIFEATKQAGVRVLISAGWGGLGDAFIPPHVHVLGEIPHDWLFSEGRVAAVVHHGGAGTTSAGLSKGLPTVVVPFFGDQGFWGNMIERAGAGPTPISPKKLNVDRLREAILFVMSDSARKAAKKMAEQIRNDDGVNRGVASFYKNMPLQDMKCNLDSRRTAAWFYPKYNLRLSPFAASTLVDSGQISFTDLKLYGLKVYEPYHESSDPVSGASSALFWAVTHYSTAMAEIVYSPMSGLQKTAVLIPEGVVHIMNKVYQGFHNVPRSYGSEVRKGKQITNVGTGLKEGGKAFCYGLYDGISGLVTEPIRGAKKNGVLGAVAGSGRSFFDLAMKPMAGLVGFVSLPMEGAWATIKRSALRDGAKTRRILRVAQGAEEMRSNSSSQQRWEVVRGFSACVNAHLQRQKAEKDLQREKKLMKQENKSRESSILSKTLSRSSQKSLQSPMILDGSGSGSAQASGGASPRYSRHPRSGGMDQVSLFDGHRRSPSPTPSHLSVKTILPPYSPVSSEPPEELHRRLNLLSVHRGSARSVLGGSEQASMYGTAHSSSS